MARIWQSGLMMEPIYERPRDYDLEHEGDEDDIRFYLELIRRLQPERVLESAVRGMLPKNHLGRQMFSKLKVYAGAEHPHAAQRPEVLPLA